MAERSLEPTEMALRNIESFRITRTIGLFASNTRMEEYLDRIREGESVGGKRRGEGESRRKMAATKGRGRWEGGRKPEVQAQRRR